MENEGSDSALRLEELSPGGPNPHDEILPLALERLARQLSPPPRAEAAAPDAPSNMNDN